MKYLVSYLEDYALKHRGQCNYIDFKLVNDGFKERQIMVNEEILFTEAANRIKELEKRVKELEKIDKVLKLLESE